MRIFSEVELNLPPRWFTGGEWANGTAQHYLRQDYFDASDKASKERKKAHAHRDDHPILEKRFEHVTFEENKGLTPIQMIRRAMRRR